MPHLRIAGCITARNRGRVVDNDILVSRDMDVGLDITSNGPGCAVMGISAAISPLWMRPTFWLDVSIIPIGRLWLVVSPGKNRNPGALRSSQNAATRLLTVQLLAPRPSLPAFSVVLRDFLCSSPLALWSCGNFNVIDGSSRRQEIAPRNPTPTCTCRPQSRCILTKDFSREDTFASCSSFSFSASA